MGGSQPKDQELIADQKKKDLEFEVGSLQRRVEPVADPKKGFGV